MVYAIHSCASRNDNRRWLVDKPWHALFYFGLLYELLSDFGRSVLRPLLGWVLGLSLRNALVLPGGGSATRLDQIYACLYGIYGNTAAAYVYRTVSSL